MTALKQRLAALIAASGPLPIADYMAHCLLDPQHGYYTTREPFGAAGDFTTAPEISQMFGELVGVWLRVAWEAAGRPLPATIAELGPGRGTLMKDLLRALRRLAPEFWASAEVVLVEASPRLRETQRAALADAGRPLSWLDSIEALPARPLFVVANEFFDALPLRQYQKKGSAWHERAVGLDADGALRLVTVPSLVDKTLLPPGAQAQPDDAVFERAPAREAAMDALAARLAAHGGAGLFIDYGHGVPGFGDTLQAVRRHRYEDILAGPGEADLTSHVDFAALAAMAAGHGLSTSLATQGEFLLGLGLLERAGRLGAGAEPVVQERLRGEVERLAGADAMGRLFKVLQVFRGAVPEALRYPPPD